MAIVYNRARPGEQVDRAYRTFTRVPTLMEVAATPNGNAGPEFIGQMFHDTLNHCVWRAVGLGVQDWILVSPAI